MPVIAKLKLRPERIDAPQPPDVVAFSDWFDAAIAEGREDDLLHYRTRTLRGAAASDR
jgi:hypothetical protein